MQKKSVIFVIVLFLCLFSGLFSSLTTASDLDDLFDQVEKLNIERQGYVLGAALNGEQMKTAAANPVETNSKNTFKFQDKNLFVVAEKAGNRVLVIYEQFEDADQKKIQDIVGDLYLTFDEPTVLAHDKVVYWAYIDKGKIISEIFDAAKKEKKTLPILATVKFVSDINIMEKAEDPAKGQVYYIISSDPILKRFNKDT